MVDILFFMGGVVTKDNKTKNTQRRIQKEIKKCKKKLIKLLSLHEEGKGRWSLNRKGKKTKRKITKTQGIIKGSKRHKKLLAYIKKLESQI